MRGSAPPWWPSNEPWPPTGGPPWRRGRRRFVRRVALALAVMLILSAIGASTVLLALLGRGGGTAFTSASLGLIAGVLLVAVLALFVVAMRRVGLPFGAVIDASERVSSGDFTVRLPEYGPPSLRAVSRAFNGMTARLQDTERRRRQFMSDIAHELRTPLSVLQGRIEGLLEGLYTPTIEQIAELAGHTRTLSRLVDDLSALARAESAELELQREPTDLGPLLHDVASSFSGTSKVRVTVDVTQLPLLDLDPVRIREVVSNIVSNAIRYSPPGGTVRIVASSTADGATIQVSDAGRGIPPQALPHVFDRFSKDAESPGSGLGLAIARMLARAHGGDVRAESQPGSGTTMTVTLPNTPSS
jgi:two-component system sensor histidine kinase BaeS